jgi:hypothetical protein
MNCPQAQHALQLDLDGELTPRRQRALRRHLADCTTCRAAAQHHTAIHSAMNRLADQSRDREGAEHKPIESPRHHRRWPRFAAIAAAMALCIVGWRIAAQLQDNRAGRTVALQPPPEPLSTPTAPPAPRQLVRVEFDPSTDVIALPKPTRNPNITILWIYPTVKTAEANPAPAVEPDLAHTQGAHS